MMIMNAKRRTFLKDAIMGATGLTLGSMTLGSCSSPWTKSRNDDRNRNAQEYTEMDIPSSNEVTIRETGMNTVSPIKSLLILVSYHHQNTRKIADVFSRVLDAPIKTPQQINIEELQEYGLIGFGSGIYDQKHHKYILDLVDKLPQVTDRNAFILSPSGISRALSLRHSDSIDDPHAVLREKLPSRGYTIVDEFNCTGWNTNSFLKLFGGMNRGRPNADDLKNEETFAQNLLMNVRSQ